MRVGFVQNKPVFAEVGSNLSKVESLLAGNNADLMVLPELFSTGYHFLSREEAFTLGESIPEGPTTQTLIRICEQNRISIIAGIAERDGDRAYNSAVVIGPEGYLGKYRKTHLFDTEKKCFDPGDLPLRVFDIGSVRVGVMICFDWRFPEPARSLALAGADVVAHPSNLVLPHCPQAMITRCLENRVFAVTADRVGTEERIPGSPLRFIGQSQVVDPDGNILIRASETDEEIQIVDIDIEKARNKSINAHNDLFKDRRNDIYRTR
ncbi:MAG: nitrilase-related carbon-nitrogen hydrolase [Nitrospinaceae bacterium]|nr:nitrilase-related carbon-nitrogen hydrolase [Nitrospinaceae bacterium]